MLIGNIDLCKKRVRYIGRACNLCWIGLGDDFKYVNMKNNVVEVAKYALHIQCAFRVKKHGKIIISDQDMYYSAPNSYEADGREGAILYDNKAKELNDMFQNNNIYVNNINLTENYDLTISMSDDYEIEIFNNAYDDDEYGEAWRVFEFGNEESGFTIGRYGEIR